MPAMMMSDTDLGGTELKKKKKKKKHGEDTRNTRDLAELIGITSKNVICDDPNEHKLLFCRHVSQVWGWVAGAQ